MATVLFIDIPVIEERWVYPFKDIINLRGKAQDCINMLSGVPKPHQKNRKQFSRGLLTLAEFIKKEGCHTAKYYSYDEIDCIAFTKSLQEAQYVAITGNNTAYFNIVKSIARYVKCLNKDIPVIVGGYHVSAMHHEVLAECKEIDYVIRGEGERTLLELITRSNSRSISGLTYRDGNRIIITRSRRLLGVADIPLPDYSILPHDLNSYNFNIQTTRGCKYRCSFCQNGFFWERPRFQNISMVLQELDFLNKRLNAGTLIHFSDNIITLNFNRFEKLLNAIISRNYHLTFSCDIKANYVSVRLIQKMTQAGFVKVCIGFEDADNSVLIKCNKEAKFEDNVSTAKTIKKNSNLFIEAYWILGLPGTTPESVEENKRKIRYLIRNNIIDVVSSCVVYTPLPGTPIFDQRDKFGLTIVTDNWDHYLRSELNPVYKLSNLDNNQLKESIISFENTILQEYLGKLGADLGGLDNLHASLLTGNNSKCASY